MSEFKEWFIIGRDQVVHSRHSTIEEAVAAASEHYEATGNECQTRKITHRGFIPEEGFKVPVAWIQNYTAHLSLGHNEDGTSELAICIWDDWKWE